MQWTFVDVLHHQSCGVTLGMLNPFLRYNNWCCFPCSCCRIVSSDQMASQVSYVFKKFWFQFIYLRLFLTLYFSCIFSYNQLIWLKYSINMLLITFHFLCECDLHESHKKTHHYNAIWSSAKMAKNWLSHLNFLIWNLNDLKKVIWCIDLHITLNYWSTR